MVIFNYNINKRPFKRKPEQMEAAMIRKNFRSETLDVEMLRNLICYPSMGII